MRDPFVVDYLTDRVIDFLKQHGIGYLKVDYNETVGIGVDGAESLGEGLRQHIEAVYAFFRRIRRRLPELVIENCASGGHRLEPSMLALSNMSSFSDAMETPAVPIIAANLQRLMLPQQAQIWAVLRKAGDTSQFAYRLASTFLGRMCLSGDVYDLDEDQWNIVADAQDFYRHVSHIIRDGFSRRFGPDVASYEHPVGWQAVLRTSLDETQALLLAHSFAQPLPETVHVDLPHGRDWTVLRTFPSSAEDVRVNGGALSFSYPESTEGGRRVSVLKQQEGAPVLLG